MNKLNADAQDSQPQVSQAGVTGISRRRFAVGGLVAAVASTAGVARAADRLTVNETAVRITTMDGVADATFFHPGEGRHPGLVLWPDAAGLRSATRDIARQLAARGFCVLMPDMHYRANAGSDRSVAQNLALLCDVRDSHFNRDGKSYASWLAGHVAVEEARDGYVLRTLVPSRSPLTPRGRGAGIKATYLVLVPGGRDSLGDGQRHRLDEALQATHRLALTETFSV